jgi:hypothetical protein
VVRRYVEDYDVDARVANMLNDYHEAQFARERTKDEPEPTEKVFYNMFDAAQKPLHGQTKCWGYSSPPKALKTKTPSAK